MKYLFIAFISILFINVLFAQNTLDFSDISRTERIEYDISLLSHDSLLGRDGASEDEYRAGNYIISQFKLIGLKPLPGLDNFRQEFTIQENMQKADSMLIIDKQSNNILAYLDNQKPYTIVIGAHYDHLGFTYNKDSALIIYNGADDNASGTAAVLEMARYINSGKLDSYNYIFACWGSEEKGLLGSNYFCSSNVFPFEKMAFYVNFDMIGRLGWQKDQIDVYGLGSSNIWEDMIPEKTYDDYKLKKMNAAVDASDHTCFYHNNTPIIYFTSGLPPQYHTAKDENNLINYAGVKTIVSLTEEIIGKFDGTKPSFREFTKREQNKVYFYFIGQFLN